MIANNLLSHIVLDDSPIDESTIVGKLFPSEGAFWDFIIQLIAMIILFLVIFFVAYKPVKKLLDKRAEYVESNIKESEKAKEEAQLALSKKDETIKEGRIEASRIIEEARVQATKTGDSIIAAAKEEASSIRKKADDDIAIAVIKSKQEAKAEIVDVAIAASSKVLGREVNEKDNHKLVEDFVAEISKEN